MATLDNKDFEELKTRQLYDIKLLKESVLSFIDKIDVVKTGSYLENALDNCDNIDYNNEFIVYAYVVLHLLDRYHRFLYMQRIMIDNKIILTKPRPYVIHHTNFSSTTINRLGILDIGTGPAPALFAFSDFYEWFKEYNHFNYEISCDYVESSDAFRDFIHFFMEHIIKEKGKTYNIPFHKGTFRNFKDIDPRIYGYDYQTNNALTRNYRDIENHFDIMIASNFFTNIEKTMEYTKDIQSAADMIRDNGLAIIVGANPRKKNKYEYVYDYIDKIFDKPFRYRKYKKGYKYTGNWVKVLDKDITLSYNQTDIGEEVKDYYKRLIELFDKKNLWQHANMDKIKNIIECSISGNSPDKWKMVIYKKHVVNRV